MPALLIAVLTLAACGRESKIYPDPIVTDPAAELLSEERGFLPTGFFNHSVNRAIVDVEMDGTTSLGIRLHTAAGAGSSSAFNDTSALGNAALLGIASYDSVKLTSLSQVSFDAKMQVGDQAIKLFLIADLNCDGATIKTLTAAHADLESTSVPMTTPSATPDTTPTYRRYLARIDQAHWRAGDSAILHPTTSAVLVPGATDPTPSSLDALLTEFPNACLRNTSSGDKQLPKGIATSAIIFAVGSNTNTAAATVFINRLVIGTDIFESLGWGL